MVEIKAKISAIDNGVLSPTELNRLKDDLKVREAEILKLETFLARSPSDWNLEGDNVSALTSKLLSISE